ncbi:MAG: aminopeptidase P family protein [Eubacteriales bacterium]
MNQVIRDRIAKLREIMEAQGVDYYMLPTADFHNSEYVGDYFKIREFLSNFSGSNGTLVVGREEAGLWTDGRYFIQAASELEGTGITLFKMAEEGVPTITEYLCENMKKEQILAFDGRVVDANLGKSLEEKLEDKHVKIAYQKDLADAVWADRPNLPQNQVIVLDEEICGATVAEKCEQVRSAMEKAEAKYFMVSKLDDIMWLFNIRGGDIACNPVALSHAFLTDEEIFLFIQKEEVTEELKEVAEKYNIQLKEYAQVVEFLSTFEYQGKVLYDGRHCSYALYKTLEEKATLVEGKNPTELLKAMKNPVELEQMKAVYVKDSAVVCKFIYWLKTNIGKIEITEVSAAAYIDQLRKETEGYLDLSFPTISGYKENAAMMHYQATEEHHKVLEPEGMLLVDSGGQYLGGTTDVTRTIAVGPVSDEVKEHFTAVARGVLQLSAANFLYGCTGRNLDILARQPLWDINIDYKCGTGHGIGYILNVHEGPQNVRWKFLEGMTEAVLEDGMVLSNEPGVYIAGSHGIRTENIMVVTKGEKNGDGQFLHFDTLTYVPIDLDLIDVQYMSLQDKQRLNAYHQAVYENIAPLMDEDELVWLKNATKVV